MSSGSSPADILFLWHMHQPDYRDPKTGVAELPWVRLHAASAYRDMALVLREHPHIKATVNFVPSLLAQIEANAPDTYEMLARRPAGDLEAAERDIVIGRFFSVHWGRQVETRPRYRELLEKKRAKSAFSARDLTDLEVLFHLAWTGFSVRAEEKLPGELEKKGAGFSEDEKIALLDLMRAQTACVLPEWRALAESGQVELISSPYYHPIVPLLCDTDAALRAMPDARLPFRFAFPEDGREQIRRAQAAHARAFGRPPRGMWPPEGSLSPEAVALYAECGVRWLAGDENVLWGSTGGVHPELLSQPHRFGGVDLVFRDRDLSDRIGFAYANTSPEQATADFLRRAQATGGAGGLCGVFLDGENAWESYEGRGAAFFRTLYRALGNTPGLRSRTISEAIADRPSPHALQRLHSGSWIDGKFAIWIGDPDKNRAWEALAAARRTCGESPAAMEQLYVAEGSDWFWWFGEPFHSAEDLIFDRLFRSRLAAAYEAAGQKPPLALSSPIGRGSPKAALPPRRFVTPRLDGLVTSYFEWDGAGRWDVPRGAAMGESRTLLASIHYAFDRANLYVRLDPSSGEADPLAALRHSEIRLHLRTGARQLMVRCDVDHVDLPVVEQMAPEQKGLGKGVGFARVEIVEIGVAFATLEAKARDRIELVVEIAAGSVSVARYPRDGHLAVDVPDENFEAENWSA